MMYKPSFNQRKAFCFRQLSRKGYALFATLGRVVIIGCLSVATLQSASAATDEKKSDETTTDDKHPTDKEATLDDVEVTGSRAPLALGQAARMVTVLSRDDIQSAPVQSINDLLKYASGVDVRQRGPIGAQTDIGIRGSTNEQITILLNGINVCDPQTGHHSFDFPCDISDIERIEILEGPAGRIYGTSSLGGAINVVTKGHGQNGNDRNDGEGEVRLEGGSFGYLSAGFIAVKNTWNQMPFRIYPGFDASYRIGNGWKIYASYNSSLRMPTFTDLYYSVGGHQADKYLKPEELHAFEGGVKYNARWLTASASVFHHNARNMIDWVMDTRETEPVWQSVNHTKVNTTGFETTATLHFKGSTLSLAYCYLHQEKDVEQYVQSQYSLEYLRHKLTAAWQVRLARQLDLTLKYRFQDRMGSYTSVDGEVCDYHPYSIVDARLAWNTDSYSLYLEGNNLTSKRYVDYGNIPQPGIWLTMGAKYRFNL